MPFPYKYFPLYAADFDTATRAMSVEAVGVYIRLLSSQWINDSIPENLVQLDRISGVHNLNHFEIIWAEIEHKFQKVGNGQLKNKRLEIERQKILKMSKQNRNAALSRWKKTRENSELDTDALQLESESESESEKKKEKISPPTSERSKRKSASPPLPDGLNLEAWERWLAYRRESGKPKWKPITIKAKTKQLVALSLDQQAACINDSIGNGWIGLFPEKWMKGGLKSGERQESAVERIRRRATESELDEQSKSTGVVIPR